MEKDGGFSSLRESHLPDHHFVSLVQSLLGVLLQSGDCFSRSRRVELGDEVPSQEKEAARQMSTPLL